MTSAVCPAPVLACFAMLPQQALPRGPLVHLLLIRPPRLRHLLRHTPSSSSSSSSSALAAVLLLTRRPPPPPLLGCFVAPPPAAAGVGVGVGCFLLLPCAPIGRLCFGRLRCDCPSPPPPPPSPPPLPYPAPRGSGRSACERASNHLLLNPLAAASPLSSYQLAAWEGASGSEAVVLEGLASGPPALSADRSPAMRGLPPVA